MTPSSIRAAFEGIFSGGKILTFHLGRERYGLPILSVREIVGMIPITHVPRTPAYLLGMVNLRGAVVPVVDTRRRFGMPARDADEKTCIVVLDIGDSGVGIVVDRVTDVTDIAADQIEAVPVPESTDGRTQFVVAIAHDGDDMLMLLDMDEVITGARREAASCTGENG